MCETDTPCSERPDGYYQDRDTQCRQYYFCQRGEKLQTLTCRGSKIFDGRTCVPPDSYTCPTGVDDVDAAASENCIVRHCEPACAKGGFFADYDSGCEQYHFCIDGKQSTLSCSANYVFNGELCVPKASYYCPRYCTPPESC
uniref:Chitin-binding type-2 domain-containing protein n=1 Tax=Anopheles maculatus TaxID=74869 RepID=A0A182SBV1_9DIPT